MGAGTTKTNSFGYVAQVDQDGNVLSSGGGGSDGVSQDSTTSGQAGVLAQGATTTAAPTYTTGRTNPLSLDTSGNLRVAISGGGGSGDASAANQTTQITAANLTNTDLGGVTETAPASDTASSGLNGRLQRIAQRLTSLIALLPASLGIKTAAGSLSVALASDGTLPLPTGAATSALQTTINTTLGTPFQAGGVIGALPAGSAIIGNVRIDQTTPGTTNGTSLAQIGANTVSTGNGVTGTGSQRVTIASDNTAFAIIAAGNVASAATDSGNPVKAAGKYNATLPTFADGQRGDVQIGTRGSLSTQLYGPDSSAAVSFVQTPGDGTTNTQAVYRTMTSQTVFNGTTWDRQAGNTVATSVLPGLSSTFWNYAAATGGISNTTTAVTIKTAAGASVRNYVTGIQVDWDALGAATEVAIRDGAAGTVLWRMKIPASVAGMREVVLTVPLKGTANTLLEVVTLTATVTGGVFVNTQGFTGA